MSVHLTISSHHFDKRCACVMRALQVSGARTTLIVPGITTIGPNRIENACIVTLPMGEFGTDHKKDLDKLWLNLAKQLDIKCGFLKIDGVYAGCILNYLQKSVCPFSESSRLPQKLTHGQEAKSLWNVPKWLYWV